MNGVHDLGGMHGFGPVQPEPNEPVFHHAWERRVFALALATMGSGKVNVDEFRRTIERMPPAHYLESSYYEHWLHAIEHMLMEKGVIAPADIGLDSGAPADAAPHPAPRVEPGDHADADLWANPGDREGPTAAVKLRRDPRFKPRFKVGEHVIARNMNPENHIRLPRYVRGHRGVIYRDWGTFVLPDTHAHGLGANPEHCYSVEFSARELWGPDQAEGERIYVDLWESYLAPEARPKTRTSGARAKSLPTRKAGGKSR